MRWLVPRVWMLTLAAYARFSLVLAFVYGATKASMSVIVGCYACMHDAKRCHTLII